MCHVTVHGFGTWQYLLPTQREGRKQALRKQRCLLPRASYTKQAGAPAWTCICSSLLPMAALCARLGRKDSLLQWSRVTGSFRISAEPFLSNNGRSFIFTFVSMVGLCDGGRMFSCCVRWSNGSCADAGVIPNSIELSFRILVSVHTRFRLQTRTDSCLNVSKTLAIGLATM